jgi:hypothetical protein
VDKRTNDEKYERIYREKGKDRITENKEEIERKKFGNVYTEETEKSTEAPGVRVTSRRGCSFLLYQTAVISVYEPSWNIPDRFLVYNRQVHDNVVTTICCIIDLWNVGRRNDVVAPFILPDEWGFNLDPCLEFQNRHRISRLPSS